jgi:peptidoglycan hydrolase CwlO-like protein
MEDNIITFFISSITGIFTYFMGHRKAKKEVENMALTNLEKSIEIYNVIISDLKQQITELLGKVNDLELKIDGLKNENAELKKMVENCNKVKK